MHLIDTGMMCAIRGLNRDKLENSLKISVYYWSPLFTMSYANSPFGKMSLCLFIIIGIKIKMKWTLLLKMPLGIVSQLR